MKKKYISPCLSVIPVPGTLMIRASHDPSDPNQGGDLGGADGGPTGGNNQSGGMDSDSENPDDQCAKGRQPFGEYLW